VPPVDGYLEAMKVVCDCYGVLLISDGVMCGMGRTGTLRAWEAAGIVPDIEVIGKSFGSGFLLSWLSSASSRLSREAANTSNMVRPIKHGQTYQFHPLAIFYFVHAARQMKLYQLVEIHTVHSCLLPRLSH
jgi:adenosylmethionine-8-amino-7-oxononanoate aminotransferase